MKISKTLQIMLRCSCLLIALLSLQGGCVMIQDNKNRENQIENASKTFVEAYMAKRILHSKEAVRDTYAQIYHLQDSVQQALRNVQTIHKLKTASLETELQEVKSLENDLLRYIDYEGHDDYSRQFGELLLSPDVRNSSDALFRMIYPLRSGNRLPDNYRELSAMAKARSTFLYNLQEYLNKRTLTASQAYRNWAETYRIKGMELHEAVLRDKRFTMTDLERIETERLAERYLAMSLAFIEKSDSLLASGKEARNPWKAAAELKMKRQLRLENLAR